MGSLGNCAAKLFLQTTELLLIFLCRLSRPSVGTSDVFSDSFDAVTVVNLVDTSAKLFGSIL